MILIDDKATIVFERDGSDTFSAKITGLVPEIITEKIVMNVGDTLTVCNINLVRDETKTDINCELNHNVSSMPNGLKAYYSNKNKNLIKVNVGNGDHDIDLINATRLLRDLKIAIDNLVGIDK